MKIKPATIFLAACLLASPLGAGERSLQYMKPFSTAEYAADHVRAPSWAAPDDFVDGQWHGIVAVSDGYTYFSVSSHSPEHSAQFYRFNPETKRIERLLDVAEWCGQPESVGVWNAQGKIHTQIFEVDGKLYAATTPAHMTIDQPYEGGHFISYDLATGEAKSLGVFLDSRGGLLTMLHEPVRNRLYAISQGDQTLCHLDLADNTITRLGTCQENPMQTRTLIADAQGNVYGCDWGRRVWRYRPDENRIEQLSTLLPHDPDAPQPAPPTPGENASRTWMNTAWKTPVWDPETQWWYAVMGHDEYLFRFRLPPPGSNELEIEGLAPFGFRPSHEQPRYGSLGLVRRGRELFYCSYPLWRPMAHLMRYHIDTGEVTNLGPIVTDDNRRVAEIHSLVVGADDTLHAVAMVWSLDNGRDPTKPWANRAGCYFHARLMTIDPERDFQPGGAAGGAWLGDKGHYLTSRPEIAVLNPDGRAWTLALHRFPWWIGGGWNRPDLRVTVTGPDGETVLSETVDAPDTARVEIPAGLTGVYRIDVDAHGGLNYWSLQTTLNHAVVKAAAKSDSSASPFGHFNPFVPRFWNFWVPPGTKRFQVRAYNVRGRSHREDHGLTVFSPRGQRMAVLWGQANPDAPRRAVGRETLAVQEADIIVEPGTAGRFWSVEVRMGDSHTYSDVHLELDGVPPWLAQLPDFWFDPDTGAVPEPPLYDETHFVQSDVDPERTRPGGIQHWTPAPALGDPDGGELLCPARIALWNPENRPLRLVVGTYLPRNMFPLEEGAPRHLPREAHEQARVRVTGADGQTVFDQDIPLLHLHGGDRWETTLRTGGGTTLLEVENAWHFWAYTYPATPAVLVGESLADGWSRFRFEIGSARNWYFRVPAGAQSFQVRFATGHEQDVADIQVHAPDRLMTATHARRGSFEVDVPPGLDGRIWHLRLDIGGATRFLGTAEAPRFPSLAMTVELKGASPYLAPTREQWFDPQAEDGDP